MQETRQFLHKFAVESVYFSENINNSTIFLEAFKFDVCVSVHHTWNWRKIPTWCNNLFIII